jgi:hypothetical protein
MPSGEGIGIELLGPLCSTGALDCSAYAAGMEAKANTEHKSSLEVVLAMFMTGS